MLNADVLTFHEFAMRETLPLATIHESVLEFLEGRNDAVLFSAQAVNAYVNKPQMTQDVDLLSTDAKNLAEELREFLSEKFHIAVRVREIGDKGLKIYQVRKEGDRRLVDVRLVGNFPKRKFRSLSMKKFFLLILVLCIFGIDQNNFAQASCADNEINLAEVKIEIKRDGSSTGCIGCTAEYSASIDGNGIVSYEGYSGVSLTGKHTFSISVEQVKNLISDFKTINFFALEDKYTDKKLPNGMTQHVSHAIKTTTTLTIGNKTKSVFNFYGAPKKLDELQEKIHGIIIKLQQND